MSQKVFRPQADLKKISCKNEFELCYIRHQYFRRATHNPTEAEMQPYAKLVEHLAKNTFYTYKNLFYLVGLESEDIVNIGTIHLVSFLGLFSLDRIPARYEAFSIKFRQKTGAPPSHYDETNKNKADMTLFLKQRMEDLVRVCRQKARNIKGLPTDEYYVYYGPKEPPLDHRELVDNYEKMGFRKLDIAVFKSIKKRIKPKPTGPTFNLDGNWYICVPIEHRNLNIVDFSGADMNPYDSLHNMDPEQILFGKEEELYWQEQQVKFDNKPLLGKISILRTFIDANDGNPEFKDEIKAARAALKTLEHNL